MNKIRFINLISFLLFIIPFGTMGCFNLNKITTNNNPTQAHGSVKIYSRDKTYIRLEEMRKRKNTPKIFFDHPKYLRNDILTTKLAAISFKEKGIKGWGKEKMVFQESELLNLSPHIIAAVSKAAPSQYVLVNSTYMKGKGFFKSGMYTIFALFISDNKLNVVFSRIQYIPMIEKGESSIFTNPDEVFTDPFSIKKNPFWKLVPSPEQRFKEGYKNWLVIDLEKESFEKEEQEKETTAHAPTGTQNVQGNQQVYTTQRQGGSYPVIIGARVSIKDQLVELKELETSGLITSEDYEKRKTQILLGEKEKTVKDRFTELRNLREKGFISNVDYDEKKRDILDEDMDTEKKKNIKKVLEEYLDLRDEGFITDEDYDYKKKQLLSDF